MLIAAVILSLLVGVSLGLLGGGGSILMVPILRYVVGMETHPAVALSLLVVGTTSLAALVPYARLGKVQWRTALVFGFAGMAGAYTAGHFAQFVPAWALLLGFGLMMLATALAMLRKKQSEPSGESERRPPASLPIAKVLAEGLVVGAVTGLVGAGGGFLVVPALVLLGGLRMDVAVGTSLAVIAMKSFSGFAGFVGHTPVDWSFAMSISAAAIAGSVVGGLLATKVSAIALRKAFGWFVLSMALFMIAQELPALLGASANPLLSVIVAAAGTLVMAFARLVLGRGGRAKRAARRALA